ncbi:uncharacterized protein [Apostichopus japonicus]
MSTASSSTSSYSSTSSSSSTERTTTERETISKDCDRPCSPGDARICLFEWEVYYYHTMLKGPCGDCPMNQTDCSAEGCIALNGISRSVVTVNGQVPGPSIIVCKDDTIRVQVTNELEDMAGITFHWHGVHQRQTPVMDGVAMVTQCPIIFGTTFTYEFKAAPAGTHLWHSHIGSNRADGLAGALVIRDSNDTHRGAYDTDDSDHILLLQDWMNVPQVENFINFLYNRGTNEANFISVNAKGRGQVLDANSTVHFTPREVIYVTKDQRHRFRIISNGFTGCPLRVSIDNHTVTAISTDGASFHPVEVDYVVLYAGERFDFIFLADQDVDNYFLRVQGIGNSCHKLMEFAIIRYRDASMTDPIASENRTTVDGPVLHPSPDRHNFTDSIGFPSLRPLDQYVPAEEVTTYYLPIGLGEPVSEKPFLRRSLPQINYISFAHPPVPLLTQNSEVDDTFFCDAGANVEHCKEEHCRCAQTITAELNETIEIFFYNGTNSTNGCHPMHLHGYAFRVVGSGFLNDNLSPDEMRVLDKQGEFPRNFQNATLKDTVCVAHGSYVIVQFVADNPGWWFLHCHLDFHALLGMALVVRVGTYEEIKPLIPRNFPKCNSWSN